MIIVRTAGELDAFLATPLGRETEPIIAPHLERLVEYEFEDIAAIAVTDAGEPLTSLGIDPESFEYREEHPVGRSEFTSLAKMAGAGSY